MGGRRRGAAAARTAAWFLAAVSVQSVGSARPIPINVINLDKDTDRWDRVTHELRSNGGVPRRQIVRIPAVNGRDLTKDELRSNATALARMFCTPGMIGCYLSHRRFWEKTLRESAPWQVVLEDDVIVADDFCGRVERAIGELQQSEEYRDDWDVLVLGAFGPVHPEGRHGPSRINAVLSGGGRRRRRATEHTQVPRRPFGTHAYVISKRGAEKLLERAWYAAGHVDCVIWGIRELTLLCCDPMLAHQDMTAGSTIGSAPSWGPEAWFPDTLKVDEYSGVTVKWALGEPLIRVPGTKLVLTIGRGLFIAFSGAFAGLGLRELLPWLLPAHAAVVAALGLLLRVMSVPVGRPLTQHATVEGKE